MRSASPSIFGMGGSTSTGRGSRSRRRRAPRQPRRAPPIPAKRPLSTKTDRAQGPMPKTHPHAEATYRVIPLDDGSFGVEVRIPENYPTTVKPFGTEADAEAWIAE